MDMSVMTLIRKTIPFFITRMLAYLIFGGIAVVFLAIMGGLGFLLLRMFGESSAAFLIVIALAFFALYGGLKFLERYVLYMIKLGHVSVLVELLQTGRIPEGKSLVGYGKDQVTENFGSSNVAFVMDKMVHAAVRQIQGWVLRIGNAFSFIPGYKNIIGIINAIMSVTLNYIDEAVMSYIFLRKKANRQDTAWKFASDGVVLYAQSWKGMLKAGAGSALFIFIFNIVLFLIAVFPLIVLSNIIAAGTPELGLFLGFLAVVGAYVFTTLAKRALIDPIVTVVMVRAYQMGIRNLEPAVDLEQKMLSVSPKFRRLFNKSKEESAGSGLKHEPI